MAELSHKAHRTDTRVPLIAGFDMIDLATLGLVFFVSMHVTRKLIASSALQLACTGGALLAAYVLLLTARRLLAPYPRVLEHLVNWYAKPDVFEPGPDPRPVFLPEGT